MSNGNAFADKLDHARPAQAHWPKLVGSLLQQRNFISVVIAEDEPTRQRGQGFDNRGARQVATVDERFGTRCPQQPDCSLRSIHLIMRV
jgi:hypothetical protein